MREPDPQPAVSRINCICLAVRAYTPAFGDEFYAVPWSLSQVSHLQLLRCPPVRNPGPARSWLKENAIATQGVN